MKEYSIKQIMENIKEKYTSDLIKEFESLGYFQNLVYLYIAYIKKKDIYNLKLELLNTSKNILSLTEDEYFKLIEYLDMTLIEKIPPQYILQKVSIFNEEYFVNEDVLIPRSDTEVLIGETIRKVNENGLKSMLDVCTGSGVIGVSVANNSKIDNVLMSDISIKAIKVARINIEKNGMNSKCKTIESNMFENVNGKFDLIVSNPPYIEKKEIEKLSNYVKKEPLQALNGGVEGLDFYKIIFQESWKYLNNNGFVMVEIGYDQAKGVINIIKKYSEYVDIEVVKDLNSKDRVVICRFHKI